ncbi:hypothetical protein [Streptomyces sp. NPDC087272]|uniref:hypothetical protein n=1 Tax=Streptomyces sp. NPDC087272 TaxID=3365775 RepID=UPI0037FC73BB
MISLYDVKKLAEQAAAYHHPQFRGVSKDEYNNVTFDFVLFTGTEREPVLTREAWSDDGLPAAARSLLEEEYREAHTLWYDAAYVHALGVLRHTVTPAWGDYLQARTRMDKAFAALATTADTHWHAAVSRLVTAQDQALEAAQVWDEQAARVAAVHERFRASYIPRDEAYARAGLDPTGWVIGYASDYPDYRGTPLVRQTTTAIKQQREHLQTVASLTVRSAV